MAEDLARLRIAAEDNTKSAFASLQSNVQQANGAFDRLKESVSASASKIGAYTALWNEVAETMKKAMSAVSDYIKESALLNARYETLGVVLAVVGRNAGYSSVEMNNYAEAVRKSGITMNESRETVIKLAQAQIDLSLASKLARAAQDAAVIANTNSSEALDRMIHGIVSGQTEVLRTMGINVSFEDSYKKIAKQLDITTEQLTEQEKVQARANVTLEYATRLQGTYEAAMGTAGKQINSLARYTEDLKNMRGEVWNEALVIAVEAYTQSLKNSTVQTQALVKDGSLKEWGRDILNVSAQVADALVNVWKIFRSGVEAAAAGIANAMAMTITAMRKATPLNYVTGDKETGAETFLYGMRDQARANISSRWGGTNTPFSDALESRLSARDEDARAKALFDREADRDTAVARALRYGRRVEARPSGTEGAEKDTGFNTLLDGLRKKLELDKESSELEKLNLELLSKKHALITPAQATELRVLAQKVDVKEQELKQLERQVKYEDEIAKIDDEKTDRLTKFLTTWSEHRQNLEFETSILGLTNTQRETAIALRKLDADYQKAIVGLSGEQLQTVIAINEKNKELLPGLIAQNEARKEAVEQQKKLVEETERMNKDIGRSLTDALLRGFDSGKGFAKNFRDTLVNMFKSLVLKPIIQPVATGLAGVVTGALGFPQAANAASGLGSLLSGGSSIGNLFGGASQTFADVGNFFGNVGAITEAGEVFGLGDAIMGFASTNPVGVALGALGLLGGGKVLSGLFGGGGGGPAHTTGVDFAGQASASGVSGQWYGNAANGKESFRFAIPQMLSEGLVNQVSAQTFASMQAAARLMGLDPNAIAGKSYGFTYATASGEPDSVVAAARAAMSQVTDQMARDLIPGIDALRQANESLTQTFQRLAAATQQQKLQSISGLMSGAVGLADYTASLKLSDLSHLTNQERLDVAASNYSAASVEIRQGKAGSFGRFQAAIPQYLTELRNFYGSSQPYTEGFDRVLAQSTTLVDETLNEQASEFARMGLTLKDIAANTENLDTRIAKAIEDAVSAWQATQASITAASTAQIVTAVEASAAQTANTINTTTAALVGAVNDGSSE